MPYLEVLNGPEVGNRAPVEQETFFLGREPSNHLILSDRTVSRKHAVINKVEGRFIISDLKSLKGLLVNGEKTRETSLEDGDEIVLGAVRLRFYLSVIPEKAGLPGKTRKKWLWVFAFLFLSMGGIIFYWGRFENVFRMQEKTKEVEVETLYREGVHLFNEKNVFGAKGALRRVLALDPEKKTPFARKAAKLLEAIP